MSLTKSNNKRQNKFKDINGRWITQGLFPETSATGNKFVQYSLTGEPKVVNGKALPLLKELYLEMMDYTEYLFANKYLGGWEHWQRMCSNALIGREVAKWREELEIKMVALGLRTVRDVALDPDSKGQLQAARYLADRGFKPKEVGRPAKKQKEAQQAFEEALSEHVSGDLDRLRSIQ